VLSSQILLGDAVLQRVKKSSHVCWLKSCNVAANADSVWGCRWDAANSELVSDEVGIAYPVINGVPHMKPESGRALDRPHPGSKEDEIPMQPS